MYFSSLLINEGVPFFFCFIDTKVFILFQVFFISLMFSLKKFVKCFSLALFMIVDRSSNFNFELQKFDFQNTKFEKEKSGNWTGDTKPWEKEKEGDILVNTLAKLLCNRLFLVSLSHCFLLTFLENFVRSYHHSVLSVTSSYLDIYVHKYLDICENRRFFVCRNKKTKFTLFSPE